MLDMPNVAKVPWRRREDGAPIVDVTFWARIITRRCVVTLPKACDPGSYMSNLLFQSTLKLFREFFAFGNEKLRRR